MMQLNIFELDQEKNAEFMFLIIFFIFSFDEVDIQLFTSANYNFLLGGIFFSFTKSLNIFLSYSLSE